MPTEEITKAEEGKQYCINNPNGICLAIAGPGTGKTYAIANRIKTILKQGYQGDRILCLTFTDTASKQMTQGIKKALVDDNMDASNLSVNVGTFHSFCMNILKNYGDKFELVNEIKVIPDSVKRIFLTDITNEIQSDYLITETGSRLLYIDAIIKGIEEIKKYNYSKEQYFKNLENFKNEKDKMKAAHLWEFYEKYEERKLENGYIDYSDMIIMVVNKFNKDKEFLKTVAESYDYILVDEYQDTNPMQNKIIYQLGEFCENIFVVGDDDQTIYSFQGAQITTMKEFINHFEAKGKHVNVVTFNGNRRSTKNIIDASRSIVLIQKDYHRYIITKEASSSKGINSKREENARNYKPTFIPIEWDENFKDYQGKKINKELTAVNDKLKNDPVYCVEYEDEEKEKYSIIEKIKELKASTPLNEIAILSPSNAELDEYAKLLKKNNIDYELKEGKNIFEINAVDILIAYLELLVDPDVYSGKFLSYLLSPIFCINSEDYITIFRNRAHSSVIQTMKDILANKLENKKFVDKDKIKSFLKTYDNLHGAKEAVPMDEAILLALNETGILEYYTSKIEAGKVESLLGIKKLIEEARGYQEINKSLKGGNCLAGFLDYIKKMIADGVKICADKPEYKLDAVQLSTYHSAKGKEYKHVFMPTLNMKKWESKSGGGGVKIEIPREENRELQLKIEQLKAEGALQYVIEDWVKRESKVMELIKLMFVGITRAKEGLYLSYTESNSKASTFLKILKEDFANRKSQFVFIDENKSINTEEENIAALYNQLTCQSYDYKKDFKELIDSKLNSMKHFSPTALNNWIKCKRRFLYEKVMTLGTDETQNGANYGTAVHNTFDDIIQKYLKVDKAIPTLDEVKEIFEEQMKTLNFDPLEIEDIRNKGRTTLDKYYETIKSWDINKIFDAEMEIPDFEIEGENFTVRIDRIDKDNDGYIIYDYKTSAKKSLKNVSKDGDYSDYFNQLAFYKYMFAISQGVDFDKIKTVLVFPKDVFELDVPISKEDCIEVKDKYLETIKKLRNLEFDKAQEDETEEACKYCSCKGFCRWKVFGD